MSIEIHQVDAFSDRAFGGNPAAVCFPPHDASDAWLAAVAAEMNLSETAFLVRGEDAWRLRWMTPTVEVDLCGHATLASAHVLFETGRAEREVHFETRSGRLAARRVGDLIELDFPATVPEPADAPPGLFDALGLAPAPTFRTRFDFLVALEDEAQVRACDPDFRALSALGVRGVMITAPGEEHDFVSRFFAPGSGIDEDPVTGSAHCALTPYWSARLGKTTLAAAQLSPRGGQLQVELAGDRVALRGRAVTVLRGELLIAP